jgi:hypothetical protein
MSSASNIELQRIEAAIRTAVTSVLEREMPIAMAIRAAAVGLLMGDPDPAASLPRNGRQSAVRARIWQDWSKWPHSNLRVAAETLRLSSPSAKSPIRTIPMRPIDVRSAAATV